MLNAVHVIKSYIQGSSLVEIFGSVVFIVRPGNGRWACQTDHCHSLSI